MLTDTIHYSEEEFVMDDAKMMWYVWDMYEEIDDLYWFDYGFFRGYRTNICRRVIENLYLK